MNPAKNQSMSQRRKVKPAKSSSQLASYAVAATGAAVAWGGANPAEAGIIWSGNQNVQIAANETYTVNMLRGLNDSQSQFNIRRYLIEGYGSEPSVEQAFLSSNALATSFMTHSPLLKGGGVEIGSSTPEFSVSSAIFVGPYDGYKTNSDKYLGVRFTPSGGDSQFFGWIGFNAVYNDENNSIVSLTITGWAYDDSGASIKTGDIGAIPEPTGLAMVALGGLAVAGRRWRRVGGKFTS